jgi:hypothetical protein
MLVDLDAAYPNLPVELKLQTSYGQLTYIYRIHFPHRCRDLEIEDATTYILVAVCSVFKAEDRYLAGLDIHFYSRQGALDVMDITSVQALVGRVKDVSNEWAS